MTTHAMLDIETLGTDPNSPVISAGVVFFNPETTSIYSTGKFAFDPRDQSNRPINFDTMLWWMNQSGEARAHWEQFPPLQEEIENFVGFCREFDANIWWAVGPQFDAVITESFLKDMGEQAPWKFWQWRDVRTLRDYLVDKTPILAKIAHDPLEDCLSQVKIVTRFYQEQAMLKTLLENQ